MKIFQWLLVFAFSVVAAQGQQYWFVDDGGTTAITQDVDLFPTNIVVGQTQSDNTLFVDDYASLSAGSVYVGLSNSTGNVLQFDPDSVGIFNGKVAIGAVSADNTMNIDPGAQVASIFGIIGEGPDAQNNSVLVEGDGSTWNVTSNLVVGLYAQDNNLIVSDGGVAAAGSIFSGVYNTATNNSIYISDASLIATDKLVVGDAGSYNMLTITNGAEVTAGSIWIGSESAAATGNVARIVGDDSTLTTEGTLSVGSISNAGNRVVVSNGGAVQVGELLIGGITNTFELNDSGLLTVDGDFDASMDGFNFNAGGALYIGGTLSGMTNGLEEGRTLGIRGTWDLTGSNITVGGSSSTNKLIVLDGGFVGADTVYVGSVSNSGNSVEVNSGANMAIADAIMIHSNNTFTVRDGGHLTIYNDFDVSQTGFDFGSGGILETTGTLTGMSNTLADARSVRLTGGNWNAGGALAVEGGSAIYVTTNGTLTTLGAALGAETNSAGNTVYVDGAGSSWNLGGALIVGGASGNNAVEITGGAMFTSGNTVIGQNSDGNSVLVSNSTWDATGSIMVGDAGSGNRLYIEDGGEVSSPSAVIGGTGTDNRAWVQGIDALWGIAGDLAIDGSGNSLTVLGGGEIDVGAALSVENGSTLSFPSNGTAVAGSYFQDDASTLEFNTVTNVAEDLGTALVTAGGTAEFEAGATIAFTGIIGDVDVGVTNSRRIVSSSSLIVDGGIDLDALNGVILNDLLKYDFISQSDDLYMLIYRQSLADSAGFESNTQMYAISGEIDQLASDGSQAAINQLDLLGDLTGAQQNTQLTQLYEQTAPAYAHMDGLFEGMRQVKNRGIMPDSMWPIGANGPHLYGSQVQGWIKGYGSWASRDGEGVNSSYDQSVYGVVLGFDKAYGDFLAGLAGGYASSDISQNNGDSSKAGTGYGVLYGSWGTSDWFADGSVALGFGSVKNDSGTIFDTSSDVDDTQFAFNLSGGKELIYMEDRLFITPSAGILSGLYSQDAYTEKASNAVAKQVDAYSYWSFQSELGVKAAYHKELTKNVLMPEVHANWLHQFNADADQLGYSLVGGTGNHSFDMQAPVADLFEVGVGLSLWTESEKGAVTEWELGFDSRFGDGYNATAFNARMLFEF